MQGMTNELWREMMALLKPERPAFPFTLRSKRQEPSNCRCPTLLSPPSGPLQWAPIDECNAENSCPRGATGPRGFPGMDGEGSARRLSTVRIPAHVSRHGRVCGGGGEGGKGRLRPRF